MKEFDIYLNKRLTECDVVLNDRVTECDIIVYSLTFFDDIAACDRIIISSGLNGTNVVQLLKAESGIPIVAGMKSVTVVMANKAESSIDVLCSAGFSEYVFADEIAEHVVVGQYLKNLLYLRPFSCDSGVDILAELASISITTPFDKIDTAICTDASVPRLTHHINIQADACFSADAAVTGTHKESSAGAQSAVMIDTSVQSLLKVYDTEPDASICFDVSAEFVLTRPRKLYEMDDMPLSAFGSMALVDVDFVEIEQ